MAPEEQLIIPYTFMRIKYFIYFPWYPIWEVSFEGDPIFRVSCPLDEIKSTVARLNGAWSLGYASGVLTERFSGK